MGSYSEPKSSCVDATAGTLVWVRRPNGSWWPGLVMAPDGLSKRKGMPVKLLGREDGNMDWYNLEKSKRIKAFRCGEYDEFIEKAKASMLRPNKSDRTGKYARREDAILHALEIERAYCTTGDYEFSSGIKPITRRGNIGSGKEHRYMVKKCSKLGGRTSRELSQSILLYGPTKTLSANKRRVSQKRRLRTPDDSEDDGIEGRKRMRGLQDLGSGESSKRESYNTVQGVGSHEQALPDNASLCDANCSNGFLHLRHVNSSRDSCSSLKRKGRQVTQCNEIIKRKNRRRPITKVLQSTARVIIPSLCHEGWTPGQASPLGTSLNKFNALELSESKKTDHSVVTNSSSDYSESSCEKALGAREDACHATVDQAGCPFENKDSELLTPSAVVDNGSFYGLYNVPVFMEENYTCAEKQSSHHHSEAGQTLQKTNLHTTHVTHVRLKESSSQGHSKERRNSNCLRVSKTTGGVADPSETCSVDRIHEDGFFAIADKKFNGASDGPPTSSDGDSQLVSVRCGLASYAMGDAPVKKIPKVPNVANSTEQDPGSRQFLSSLCTAASCERQTESFSRSGSDSLVPTRKSLPHEQMRLFVDRQDVNQLDRTCANTCLYEVKVDVQTSSKGGHVPLVSLMSKSNSKAVIGNPISVEVINSVFCDTLVSSPNCCPISRSKALHDGDIMSRQSIRTVDGHFLHDGFGYTRGKLQKKNGCTSKLYLKGKRTPYVDHLGAPSHSSKKKSCKNKKSVFLSRKIRKLSSITVDCDHREKGEPFVEKPSGPIVGCVPVKLVFSRINEALGSSLQ